MTIRISIITAVLNSVNTIGTCIESIKQQSYAAEHVIVDGLSKDGSIEIINKLRNPDSIFLSEPDSGFYDALNKGISMASGNIIGILNADDVYAHAHVLERVSACFTDCNVASCYGDLVYVNPLDTNRIRRYWRSGPYREGLFLRGWMPPHPTFFVRREAYTRYGGFNLGLGTAADYELMLRFLVKHRITARYIPEVLVKMRVGGQSNAALRKRLTANLMDRKAWEINGLKPYPWTLLMKPILKISQYFIKPIFDK